MFAKRAALGPAFLVALALGLTPREAPAIPMFAQRYNLLCGACHSVHPELNQFGNEFRNRGYRIDGMPQHGTTLVALREQVGYARDPAEDSRRICSAAVCSSCP